MTTSTPEQTSKSTVVSGIVLTILSGLSFACTGLVANALVDDGSSGVVVGFYEAVFGLLLVMGTNVREISRRPKMSRVTLGWAALAAAGFAIAFGTFYTALASMDYSVGVPILGAIPLVSYAVALVLLRGRERITRRALAGAVLVVAGVGIIGATS
jgi:drug/metabolite transporter (DMT)-like permease